VFHIFHGKNMTFADDEFLEGRRESFAKVVNRLRKGPCRLPFLLLGVLGKIHE
jgi:hypothetical protein